MHTYHCLLGRRSSSPRLKPCRISVAASICYLYRVCTRPGYMACAAHLAHSCKTWAARLAFLSQVPSRHNMVAFARQWVTCVVLRSARLHVTRSPWPVAVVRPDVVCHYVQRRARDQAAYRLCRPIFKRKMAQQRLMLTGFSFYYFTTSFTISLRVRPWRNDITRSLAKAET